MVVRFKLDENIRGDAAALLRVAGHEVQSVIDEHLEGTPDAQLLDACRNESRLLITLDLDFADIRAYPPSSHAGIWVLRPQAQNIETILALLRGALALLPKDRAERRLWIVESDRVRIRDAEIVKVLGAGRHVYPRMPIAPKAKRGISKIYRVQIVPSQLWQILWQIIGFGRLRE